MAEENWSKVGWGLADSYDRRIKDLESQLAEARRELSRCGKENCMGFEIDGVRSWVAKEALQTAEERAEAAEAREQAALRALEEIEEVAERAVEEEMLASSALIAEIAREALAGSITPEEVKE